MKEIKGKPKQKGFGFGNIFADGGGANVLRKMKSKQSTEELKPEPKVLANCCACFIVSCFLHIQYVAV